MECVDVVVVGGGPAGVSAAYAAAEGGAEVVVLEKGVPREDRKEIGPDSTDAAGMLDYWVDIMELDLYEIPDEVFLQELDQANFVSPNEAVSVRSTGLKSSYDCFGFTFHRARFDDFMRERAEAAGARYLVGESVVDVETDLTAASDTDPRHVVRTRNSEIGAQFVVLADGPQRAVTNRVLDRFLPESRTASERLSSKRANHIAYQEYRRVPPELFKQMRDSITFWWGYMPGHTAYPWMFPNQDRVVRFGLTKPIGLELNAVEHPDTYELLESEDERIPRGETYIERLLETEFGDTYDIESDFPLVKDRGKNDGTETYPISSTRPIDSPVRAGIAVVGGAMGTTSAFHEGGDHVAVRTGHIAGELAASGNLSRYNDMWKAAIGDEVVRNVAMADVVQGYKPDDWDQAFAAADEVISDDAGYDIIRPGPALSVGWGPFKSVAAYIFQKFRIRNGRYVQLSESEYRY